MGARGNRLVALSGGTGGAKLVQGLSLEAGPEELTVICNTGDDLTLHGLHISPDIDTITYTLAGIADTHKGWGVADDSFAALEWLGKYGGETWFKLGDRDLALHLIRSDLLRRGFTLSQVTGRICSALGVRSTILPMSDDRVETKIRTPRGEISFQEYFVKERWAAEVSGVAFVGAEQSRPAPAVLPAIADAAAVIVCPSNPVTSIGPILAVPGIRKALRESRAKVLAVSPLARKAPFSGPTDKLMAAAGMEVSSRGVAAAYADFVDLFFLAHEDESEAGAIGKLGVAARAASIRMDSVGDRRRLAREVLSILSCLS